jgi:hypothetical protein
MLSSGKSRLTRPLANLMEGAVSSTTFNALSVIPTLLQAIKDNLDIATRAKVRISAQLESITQQAQSHRANAAHLVDATNESKKEHIHKAKDLKQRLADLDSLQGKVTDAIEFMLRRKNNWETWIEIGNTARVVGHRVFFEKAEDAGRLDQIKKKQLGKFQQVEETYALIRGLPVEFKVYVDGQTCR